MDRSIYEDLKGSRKIMLFDIFGVGQQKPIGYLPVDCVTKYSGKDIAFIRQELASRGIETAFHRHSGERNIDYLIAWHTEATQALIAEHRNILEKIEWPQTPVEFAIRAASDTTTGLYLDGDDGTSFERMLHRAYADPKSFPGIRPTLGNGAAEIMPQYWLDRKEGHILPVDRLPLAELGVPQVIEIMASECCRLHQEKGWAPPIKFTVDRRHHHYNNASLWRDIAKAADFSDYSAAQIKGMLRQLNHQARQLDLSTEFVWQPNIAVPPAKTSAFAMIGSNPAGQTKGS